MLKSNDNIVTTILIITSKLPKIDFWNHSLTCISSSIIKELKRVNNERIYLGALIQY